MLADEVEQTDFIIFVGNTQVIFEDAQPIVKAVDGGTRTLVPLRKVGNMLSASVYWIEETSSIQIVTENRMILFQIGNYYASVYTVGDDNFYLIKDIAMDEAPAIYNDRTYVPLRAASDLLLADLNVIKNDINQISDFKYGVNSMVNGNSDLGYIYIPMREYKGEGNGITTRTGVLVNDDLGEYYLETDDNSLYKLNISEAELINQIGDSDFNIEKNYRLRVSGLWDKYELILKRRTTSIVCEPTIVTINDVEPIYILRLSPDLLLEFVPATSASVLPGTVLNLLIDEENSLYESSSWTYNNMVYPDDSYLGCKVYSYFVPHYDSVLTATNHTN